MTYGRCSIPNAVFEQLTQKGGYSNEMALGQLHGKRASIRIWANDETSVNNNVLIENLTVPGEKITSPEKIPYEESPFSGPNIILR